MMLRKLIVISLVLLSVSALAQEQFYSLEYNGLLHKNHLESMDAPAKKYDTTFVVLPFYDDFSRNIGWPSPLRWADNEAFINTDYALFAPTVGVATLDAINEKGSLHEGAGPYPFEADHLTSQPIRLDSVFAPVKRAIFKSDSVYFSFYFQPQGRGSMPSKYDSLVLEFHSPSEFDTIPGSTGFILLPKWHVVWSTGGGVPVDTFAVRNGGRYFRQVLIPVTDSIRYFKKGFRFRFRNYASLANNFVPDWQSNGDQWNIDLVMLNIGRSAFDTTLRDVAFADRPPSMLRNYESMPLHQYSASFVNEMAESVKLKVANLDKTAQNLSYNFTVQMDSQPPYYTYNGGSYSILPYATGGYLNWPPITNPPISFFYSIGTPKAVVFHTSHFITTDIGLPYKQNDTLRYTQVFSNYYAYDDGTAEAGVGLNGAKGSYAIKFKLNKPDTLRGVQIYFNQTRTGGSQLYFDLNVWNDAFGNPGTVIKTLPELTPVYTDSLNAFYTFWFEEPLLIEPTPSGNFPGLIFYVGWSQHSNDNLNIGLDRYNDTHSLRYYNVDGSWQQSDELHAGSVMIRPIVGLKNPLGTSENPIPEKLTFTPNPVSDGFARINLPDHWNQLPSGRFSISLYDLSGKQVRSEPFSNPYYFGNIAEGLYIIRVSDTESGQYINGRIIVKH